MKMDHQFPPHAPPIPPPVPMPHPQFSAMGMDHGHGRGHEMPMDPLIDDFQRANIQTIEPRFEPGSFDDRPLRGGRGPNPRRTSNGNAKKPMSYEGFIFTKVKPEHAGQRETWAVARRAVMPVSQAELRGKVNVKPSLFSREKPVMEQFGSLHENQRRQIDRLIDDRMRMDDPNFEYQLAFIKVEQSNARSSRPHMIVILRRKVRPGVPIHPEMPETAIPGPPSEIIDVTGADDSEKSSLNSFGSFSPPPQPHPIHPFERHNSEPMGFGHHPMDDRFGPMRHGPALGEEQGHGKPSRTPVFGFPVEDFHGGHGGHGGKDNKEDKYDKHDKGEKHDKKDKHEKHDRRDSFEKHDKKEKKDKRPEVHHSNSHKSNKKDHGHSHDFSSESDWEHLSGGTEDTMDTFPTSSSGGSKVYKKEKKYGKEEKHKAGSHHNSRDRGAERPIYREHYRKVPEKQREPSPAPSRRSGRSSGHYAMDDDVFIQPEVSHRGGRESRREPRPRQVSYSRERPSRHQRAMSYDDEPQFDLEYEDPPSPAYIKKVTRLPRAAPIDYEKERLKLELDRERREREYLGEELGKTHEELRRASRMPPPRERFPPRQRRPPPIIEREPPYPRPRRVQEPYYDDYDDYEPRYY